MTVKRKIRGGIGQHRTPLPNLDAETEEPEGEGPGSQAVANPPSPRSPTTLAEDQDEANAVPVSLNKTFDISNFHIAWVLKLPDTENTENTEWIMKMAVRLLGCEVSDYLSVGPLINFL